MSKTVCDAITSTKRSCTKPVYATTWRYESYLLGELLLNAETRCVHHLTEPERAIIARAVENTEQRYLAAFEVDPACWSWPLPPPVLVPEGQTTESAAWDLLNRWHGGRCAACGHTAGDLCRDHDHMTGLVRGLLCAPCNGRESRSGGTGCVYDRYRSRPPAAILNIVLQYVDPITRWPTAPRNERRIVDEWTDNALAGIGL